MVYGKVRGIKNAHLFQGDSITDAGRDYSDYHELGQGYPKYAAELIRDRFDDPKNGTIEFINLGISGHRTRDLRARWQKDCIDLQPDIVSIMIGINDTWRAFDSNDPTPVEEFEDNYRYLLSEIKAHTNAKILLLEPYVLPDVPAKDACARISTRKFRRCGGWHGNLRTLIFPPTAVCRGLRSAGTFALVGRWGASQRKRAAGLSRRIMPKRLPR